MIFNLRLMLIVFCFFIFTATVSAQQKQRSTFPFLVGESLGYKVDLPSRDPFNWSIEQQALLLQYQKPPQQAFDQLTLQAIFFDDVPQAVINEISLFQGDKIGDVLIVDIERDTVTVRLNDFEYILGFADYFIEFE